MPRAAAIGRSRRSTRDESARFSADSGSSGRSTKERLDRFETDQLAPLFKAIEALDQQAFEHAFTAATDDANLQHAETGYEYIRWKLPDEPPKDLDLGPQKA